MEKLPSQLETAALPLKTKEDIGEGLLHDMKYPTETKVVKSREDFEKGIETKEQINKRLDKEECNEIYGEYDLHNMDFWWFIIGAFFISLLCFAAINKGANDSKFKHLFTHPPRYSNSYDEYKKDKEEGKHYHNKNNFHLIANEGVLVIGFTLVFFLTAFVEYHHYKRENGKGYRYASLFLMVLIWTLSLIWCIMFMGQHNERDSTIVVFLLLLFTIVWIYISFDFPGKHSYSGFGVKPFSWLLFLPLLWFLYLFYYNILASFQVKCKCSSCIFGCKV